MIKNFIDFLLESSSDSLDNVISKASKDAKLDVSKFSKDQLRSGYKVELEHGKEYAKTNVTDDDPVITLKIVLAHLNEDPSYYTKLSKMEKTFKNDV